MLREKSVSKIDLSRQAIRWYILSQGKEANLAMKKGKTGSSVIEYITLIAIIAGALMISQRLILQAISGRWRNVGDSFGAGRQYDPKRTIECVYDTGKMKWVVQKCNGVAGCSEGADCN